MKTITFTCETITPMFLSGADASTPELRPPSIKGALRFWWRAMNGHLSLEELKKKESEIFGGTEPAQRSKVIMRIGKRRLTNENTKQKDFLPKGYSVNVGLGTMHAIDYLAYGIENFDPQKSFNREYLRSQKEFDLVLSFPENLQEEILKTLFVFSYFGGLGAKSRNGLGSISINYNGFNDIEVKELFKGDLKSYTSFSKFSKLYKGKEFTSPYEALSEIAVAYHHAKSSLKQSEKQYIALPMQGSTPPLKQLERHTKPYFLSLHKTNNTQKPYQGKILFLPYKYLQEYKDRNGREIQNLGSVQEAYDAATQKFNEKLQEKLNLV
ncbi:type III-B CRISPR module RAMP protein Cmr1 [Rhodoflexus caldus]|uniref:type III-B CRISPR module RAMP protein Cmr1 n=1 Tax=Rhodoflexus caldus TaxID=2891236 RepID=UPI00202A24D8|nr:type III-B CRISPR module RAMP protein Cmr1 [Rhodoflexus caldus]